MKVQVVGEICYVPAGYRQIPVVHYKVAIQQPEIHDDDHDHKNNTKINIYHKSLSFWLYHKSKKAFGESLSVVHNMWMV